MFENLKSKNHMRFSLLAAATLLATTIAPQAHAQTITQCTSAFGGTAMVVNRHFPHDAFVAEAATAVVKHISTVQRGAGPCNFGALLPDISLGAGINSNSGMALDAFDNLFVAVGPGNYNITEILEFTPPYTAPPTVFYTGTNIRGLAISGETLYAADFAAGTVLRFDLTVGPSSVTTMATVPGVFGIFAAGHDDLFVTSNGGYTGVANGVGTDAVLHITRTRAGGRRRHHPPVTTVTTIATGLGFPEGIGGDQDNLYIASGAEVFTVPVTGGTPTLYAGSPILFTHDVTVWSNGGYAADSYDIYKFTLLP